MTTRNQADSARRIVPHAIAFVCVALISGTAAAASFDCGKARSPVEKTVCSDGELSNLDGELGISYGAATKLDNKRPMIVAEQKKWLADTRNKCVDAACLRAAYKTQIAWLNAQLGPVDEKCPVEESQLIGHWVREGNGHFEEFYIMNEKGERLFASWLHKAPEYLGTWQLKHCTLHLKNDNESNPSFDYQVTGIRRTRLYLFDKDEGDVSTYRKLEK